MSGKEKIFKDKHQFYTNYPKIIPLKARNHENNDFLSSYSTSCFIPTL